MVSNPDHDSALNDLREIVDFIAEDDPGAAARLGEKPLSGRWTWQICQSGRLHDARRGIRKNAYRPYLIFYTCDKSGGRREHPAFCTARGAGRSSRSSRAGQRLHPEGPFATA